MIFESTGIPDGFFRWLFVVFRLYENVDGVDAIRICGQLAFSLEGTLLRKTISGTKPALDAEEKFPGMGGRGSVSYPVLQYHLAQAGRQQLRVLRLRRFRGSVPEGNGTHLWIQGSRA